VAENRNSGMLTMVILSKSVHERMKQVAAKPVAEKAAPSKVAQGRVSSDHQELVSPRAAIRARKAPA
jgi:hypothetical protein